MAVDEGSVERSEFCDSRWSFSRRWIQSKLLFEILVQ